MHYLLLSCLILLAACGHRTPLVPPSDIPAYEQKREEKRKKYEPYREKDDSWF
jgi:predicted small lipoprotein YifL